MCGITGLICLKGQDCSFELVHAMTALKHRGFNGFGLQVEEENLKAENLKELYGKKLPGNLGIACNRLAVTGEGLQPFQSCDRKISLVHNGEIYNYLEIKEELKLHKFESNTDSEIIVHFLEEQLSKGKTLEKAVHEFMQKARGSYAVILKIGEELYAFRDFVGVRPLWFGTNNDFLAVSSEPKPLRKINIIYPQPLLPGHLLKLSSKGTELGKIFTIQDFRKSIPKKTSLNELKNSLLEAVEIHTRNVKKCGVFFSGGLDSSIVAKLVSEKVKNLELITVGLQDSEDIVSSEIVAKELDLKFSPRIVEKDELPGYVLRCLEHLPFFDQMQLEIGLVEFIASEHAFTKGLKVCFSGQGSDEIFAGYSYYKDAFKSGGEKSVEEMQWGSLDNIWSRNLMRDDLMAMANTVEIRLPFLDSEFLKHAMALPVKEKIFSAQDELRKHALRKIALELGVPKIAAEKPKKALQYGSGLGKEIKKLFSKKS
ncbi:MAG: asparagine synthetase B [Candidatus Diapherotrites archaeon]|nr:asparagine synthetase B [Candidatus Diapherotrites archaeon]